MLGRYERKLIKKDALLVLVQNWKSLFLASLPLMILMFLWDVSRVWVYSGHGIENSVGFFLFVLFFIPSVLCQSEAILSKVRMENKDVILSFHWLSNLSHWWKGIKFFLLYAAGFLVFFAVMGGLNAAISHVSPTWLPYMQLVIAIAAIAIFAMLAVFIIPPINRLISYPKDSISMLFKRSFLISRKYFRSLFAFSLSFVFLYFCIALLNVMAQSTLLGMQAQILPDFINMLIYIVLFVTATCLNIYINTGFLSYVDLLTERENL